MASLSMSIFSNIFFGASKESKVKTVLVCGSSGVGKSHFINIATGANLPMGDDHELGTRSVIDRGIPPLVYDEDSVQLVDTPGFQNTRDTNEIPVLSDIVRWLADQYRRNRKFVGLIYLRSIQDPKVLRHEAQIIQVIKDLCGEDSLDRVMVITNRWQPNSGEVEERRERGIVTDIRKFGSRGSKRVQVRRLQDGYTTQDVRDILRLFATHTPVVFKVQREVVDNRVSFNGTTAGRRIEANIREQIEGNDGNNAARGAEVGLAPLEENLNPWPGIMAVVVALLLALLGLGGVARRRR